MSEIFCKRIYDRQEGPDDFRILVDRLWPRGMKKDTAGIDLWAKDIAPSNELRKWFGHDPNRFTEFQSRYLAELSANPDASEFSSIVKSKLLTGNVTLLYSAKDATNNNAAVVKDWLEKDFEA